MAYEKQLMSEASGFDGYLNHTPCRFFNTTVNAGRLSDHIDYPGLLCVYYYDGAKWKYSLRSKAKVDCAEIAATFGGGGHFHAAGFSTKKLISNILNQVYGM